MLTACITESTYVLVDPASVNRMLASQCSISSVRHWSSTRENSEIACSTILHIPRILSAWGIKERTPLLQTPEHKTTSPSHTALETSKHVPKLKGSEVECEHFQLQPRLQMMATVRRSSSECEWHKLWTEEPNGDTRGETQKSKNEIWSKLPKPIFLSLCVNITVIQEASAAVLIRVSHTWEALMPIPPTLSLSLVTKHYLWTMNFSHIKKKKKTFYNLHTLYSINDKTQWSQNKKTNHH